MPVRSLSSRVVEWPTPSEVDAAVRDWARRLAIAEPGVARAGYFGSFARNESGVGSDVDIVVVTNDDEAKARVQFADRTSLPVPADVLVLTLDEWASMQAEAGRFATTLAEETRWVYERARDAGASA